MGRSVKVLSVNVGLPRTVDWNGKKVSTGIFKTPVEGPVIVRTLNLDGDGQADLSVHGGTTKAVYGYPSEHYPFWHEALQGQSGNPNGRPPGGSSLAARIRTLGGEDGRSYVEMLHSIAMNEDESTWHRIEAVKVLLRRGYGNPHDEVPFWNTANDQGRRIAFHARRGTHP